MVMHLVSSSTAHGMARVRQWLDTWRQWDSCTKSLHVAMVSEPKASSTDKTGQGTCFSTMHLFQLWAHNSNSNASNQPRDEGRESKTKLPNGESGCRGKHHGQKKEADSINHTFGNMMFRRDWLWSILCSMVWTVTMLCATRNWIQWMRALQTRSALDKSFLP